MNEQTDPRVEPECLDVSDFELQPGTSLIEASAGTGKTYTIQYIVLDLLFKGLRLPEILIVTFTEAATKELSDRLQAFLAKVHAMLMENAPGEASIRAVLDRAVERQGEDAVRRILSRAMLEIDQAAIYTIHGFCQRSLQENAFAADANFDVELCADLRPVVEGCVMDFLRRAQFEMLLPPPSVANKAALTERGLKLAKMLRMEEPYKGDLGSVGAELRENIDAIQAYASEVDAIVAEFMSFEGKLNARSYKADFFESFEATLRAVLEDPLASDLSKLREEKIQSAFKKDYKGTELQSGFFRDCQELDDAKGNLEASFLKCFDTWFIEAIQRVKSERGIMTYDDMILDLERALKESPRLQTQLRERYRAALVDEFQDTDDRQYQIFRTLFGSDDSGERFFAMIGDPKQSIYAFRGADISAYLLARQEAAHRYTLPVNYRSEHSMVEGSNAFFEGADLGRVFGEDEAESISFAPVQAADRMKERLVFSGESVVSGLYERALEPPQDGKVKTAHQQSAALTAEDIRRLLDFSGEGKVYFEDSDSGARRRVDPGDIAVLVSSHKEALDVQEALQRHRIVAVRSKAGSLVDTDEAKVFLYFLMACLEAREPVINLLLASSLFGKTASEMLEMPDAERREIYEQFTLLGNQWRDGAAVSLIWMELLDHLDARERLLAKVGGERVLTNYLHMAEFAQELERGERLSPERLCDRLLEVIENGVPTDGSEEEYLVRLESDARAVRITTMHSAKGLEFPIVFLPSLWQRGINKSAKEEARLQCAPEDPDCYVGFASDREEVLRATSAENLRLGYVALTRARHFTVYYNLRGLEKQHGASNQADGWFDQWLCAQRGGYPTEEPHEDFLEELREAPSVPLELSDDAIEVQPRVLGREISRAYQITSYSSLARTTQNHTERSDPSMAGGMEDHPVEPSVENPLIEIETPEAEPNLLLENFPGGVRTGTCIHELLERCDFTDSEPWDRIARSVIGRHFPDGGSQALDRRVGEVLSLLGLLTEGPRTGAGGSKVDLAVLAPQACIPEMEFYFPVDQVDLSALEAVLQSWGERVGLTYTPVSYQSREIIGFLTGSVDLFFKQAGRFYILDWKTNRPLSEHPPLRQSYDRTGIHAHMVHGRYYMQALIYTVAAAAYLRLTLGEHFNWDAHMGGFIYCFVRGLDTETGWLHESFSEEEVLQASRALGQQTFAKGDV